MTPAARLSAAIAVLDRHLGGENAERALTGWARGARYAGSGDRLAVRDLVFDALRHRSSYAALGGGLTGRGLILGALRARGEDPARYFTGEGHAPAKVGEGEAGEAPGPVEALDIPDWLWPELTRSLGDDCDETLRDLAQRAPVFLRVNLVRIDRETAQARLAAEGIETRVRLGSKTALEVTDGSRKIQNSAPYAEGLLELQDLSSQAVVEALPLTGRTRVLDYCAGGGGKALAMAGSGASVVHAHDAHPRRMVDLPERAARAKADLRILPDPGAMQPWDLILCDVPCSGSGAWRRDPEAKWALTPQRLAEIHATQAEILDRVAPWVGPEGVLAYATCSVLQSENEDQIAGFLARHPGWAAREQRFSPLQGGDGFYLALLTRAKG